MSSLIQNFKDIVGDGNALHLVNCNDHYRVKVGQNRLADFRLHQTESALELVKFELNSSKDTLLNQFYEEIYAHSIQAAVKLAKEQGAILKVDPEVVRPLRTGPFQRNGFAKQEDGSFVHKDTLSL